MRDFLGRQVLEKFLLSDAVPQDGMGLYELDGFLTGLAAGPVIIHVEEWLPLVWGSGAPRFRSVRHRMLIQDLIIRHHDEIARALTGPCDHTELLAIEDIEERILMAYAWSDGFLQALELRPEAWLPLVRDAEACKVLLPLLTLYREALEHVELPLSQSFRRGVLVAAAAQIPGCGYTVKRFWEDRGGKAVASSSLAGGVAEHARAIPLLLNNNGAGGANLTDGEPRALVDNVLPLLHEDQRIESETARNIDEAVMITNLGGVILSVNTTFTAITGFPVEEVLGNTPRILKSHLTQPPHHVSFWSELTTTGHWHGSIWNRSRDGTLFRIRQTVSTIKNARDQSVGYVAVFEEIDRQSAS
jgi:uncharacterized protein